MDGCLELNAIDYSLNKFSTKKGKLTYVDHAAT